MVERFPCPYFGVPVELTAERRLHVESKHSEILPGRLAWLAKTLSGPELVLQSQSWDQARLFVRGYHEQKRIRYTVVVVVTDMTRIRRRWITTAYLSRDLPKGVIEWRRS